MAVVSLRLLPRVLLTVGNSMHAIVADSPVMVLGGLNAVRNHSLGTPLHTVHALQCTTYVAAVVRCCQAGVVS
jgi:hypothetical protein